MFSFTANMLIVSCVGVSGRGKKNHQHAQAIELRMKISIIV